MSTKGLEKGFIPDKTRRIARRRKAENTLSALICTAAVGVGFSAYLIYQSYYSVGWHTHAEGTYYISPETNERVTGYQMIDNTCYLFDANGIILPPGWQSFRGDTYYLGKDGIIQRGTIEIDGEDYYFSTESGIFRTGLCDINGDEYYFDDHGFPGSGFSGNSYFDENGRQYSGWVNVGGAQYYFKNDGNMAVGFFEIDGEVYYFDKDGKMATDWKIIDGERYLFNESGVIHRGWIEKDGKYYYADSETGACARGFYEIDGNIYYFDSQSEMVKNWKKIDGKVYHFSTDGVMTTGWYEEQADKYYFDENGAASQGFTLIKDDYYYFDEEYKLKDGWQTIKGRRYYFGRGGVVASGWTELESDDVNPFTGEPKMLTYYFYPETHQAAYGWASIGSESPEVKLFKKEMADMRRFDRLSEAEKNALTGDDRERYLELKEKYKDDTINKFQRDAYEYIGADILGDYYFYSDYTLAHGWIEVGGYRFYYDEETGKKTTGWATIHGDRYYFGETGAACTGEFEGDEESYVFSSEGVLSDGLVKINGQIKYKTASGEWLREDFHTEESWYGEKTYYFDEDGNAVTGRTIINDELYFFGDNGVMKLGVHTDGSDVYFLTINGVEKNKWVNVEDGRTFYFGSDGKAYKGWKRIGDFDFYFGDDGVLQEGWTTIEGKKYYLEHGVMLRGPIFVDDDFYNLGENGYVTEGWLNWAGARYYNLEDGLSAIGWQNIDGDRYYFDWNGVMLSDTVVDGVTLGADGKAVD